MITLADSNNDGYVEYHEFQKVLENHTNNNNSNNNDSNSNSNSNNNNNIMEDVFKVMDKYGDRKVGIEDLKSYLRLAGLNVSVDDVMAMVKLGGGSDGGVTYEGFLNILAV
ncbi:hypothetical protein LIER_34866 [Lithospermum erythrorhizon]|uniref:EF-hand domain-containing protein n=1 Tax=Lithospermum erythrorhizon TaxID=34254 RepID=A0AAV3S0S8_LITER